MKLLLLLVLALFLTACYAPEVEVPENITVTHEFDFLVVEAINLLTPFGEVGKELDDPLMLDDEPLFCSATACVTAGDFRDVAQSLLMELE